MKFEATRLRDVYLLHPQVFGDERGFFLETWNQNTFSSAGFDLHFVQDNQSRSQRGILRGLHYQTERTQGKLVRVTAGTVYDVAVDLRRSSPSFGQWYGAELSAANHAMLWVPPGFAHGFYVLSDYADFLYKCTALYHPESEVCLAWDDPDIGIKWPLPEGEQPHLSGRDASGLSWDQAPKFD
jgi:dTDP-4-dehydrorhamnose 3,5-epimerase